MQIRSALDKYSSREQRRQREAQERDELMAGAAEGRRLAREMDEEAALMGSTQRANQQLNELYETGANILSTMAGSRERLKVGAVAANSRWLWLQSGRMGFGRQCTVLHSTHASYLHLSCCSAALGASAGRHACDATV